MGLHTVIKLSPVAYGCKMEKIEFDVPKVSTYRTKPVKDGILEQRFYRAHRPQLEDMTGIEGLFETLTTEAQEAANQHVKYKELGSCLPDYHKAANGTNGTTNGIKQTNRNYQPILSGSLERFLASPYQFKMNHEIQTDFQKYQNLMTSSVIEQHQRIFQNNFNNFRIQKT